jgi:hypothetical protein
MSKIGKPSKLSPADHAEIIRRCELARANSSKLIGADFGISRAWVNRIYNERPRNANPSPRRAPQEGDVKHLGKGL